MKMAMIGLGKMGMAMAERLLRHGHEVVVYDLAADRIEEAARKNAIAADSMEAIAAALDESPRVVWIMVPAGEPVEATVGQFATLLKPGDIVIDGGNSRYTESVRRAETLAERGIHLLDVGVSGGIWGLTEGFNLMAGGDEGAFRAVEPLFEALAPEDGYMYVGPSGAGHFVKMVHNGIEYGVMQAMAEGFELMAAKTEYRINLGKLADLWMHGSVIRSWLLELTARMLQEDPGLDTVEPYVNDSGEGRWTVQESIELAVPTPVITLALQMRFRSRQANSFAGRMLASLRNQFGGHAVLRAEDAPGEEASA